MHNCSRWSYPNVNKAEYSGNAKKAFATGEQFMSSPDAI
jgi:hypothetical protein